MGMWPWFWSIDVHRFLGWFWEIVVIDIRRFTQYFFFESKQSIVWILLGHAWWIGWTFANRLGIQYSAKSFWFGMCLWFIYIYWCVNHRYTYVPKYIYNIFNIPIIANLYDTLKTINVYKRDMSHFLVVAFPLYLSVVVSPLYLVVSPSVSGSKSWSRLAGV